MSSNMVAHSLACCRCLNHWQIQHVCRMLSALCVRWWTCLNRMLLLTNGIMKNQPTLFQQAWKTHIKGEVKEEGKKTRQMKKTRDRTEIKKSKKRDYHEYVLGQDFEETAWQSKSKSTKHTSSHTQKYNDGQKHRVRAKKRTKEKEWIKDWKNEQKQKQQKTGETGGYI